MQVSSSPERWAQVQRLFDEVVTLSPEARATWLEQACGTDTELRREVEVLLSAYASADDLLRDLDEMAPPPRPEGAVSSPRTGTHVAHYEVRAKLGGGGMGVVYEAYDARLHRTVALKFLSPLLSHDKSAQQRLLAEARAAATLDHPNVGTIHEIGEADGQTFIAMALYQGETLSEKISQGPLPVREALDYAIQIARGLATAHAHGIVHRDVKPANIIVVDPSFAEATSRVKIVDFGLAKMADVAITKSGTTLGTVAYMSPEQARGEAIDQQTDVWALGVVLYEMLAGERPFQGDYEQAVVYTILNGDPPSLRAVNPETPEDLEHVVARCLEKERAHRYQTMADVLTDLEVLNQGGATGLSSTPPPRGIRRTRSVLAGLGALGAILVLILALWKVVSEHESGAMSASRFLAVLPFDNVGNDPQNQAFIDGLVYTITSKLTEMEQFQDALSVVPARDVLQAGLLSTRAAADQFKVNLVLSGSVQRSTRGVRIHLQLVDPKEENKVLASRQLDEPVGDIAALQDGVVFKLAELLEVELNSATESVLTAGRTALPIAYDFYTQALGYLQRFEDESNIDAAISLFQLAIKEDSAYALAYAGLGEAYLRKYKARNISVSMDAAIRNGEQAVALDDDLAPVHVTLGMIYFETGRYEQAELAYLRALALEPKNAAAHHQLGDVYSRLDKRDKAEESYQKAIALKPGYWLYHNDLGQFYHRLGRHQDAIPKFEDVIALQPDNPWGYNNVGAQHARMGRTEEAILWYQKAAEVNPKALRATAVAHWNLGGIYYARDDFAEAARRYEQVGAFMDVDRDTWENLGDAYYWAGDREAARPAWQRAVALAQERLTINQKDAETLGMLAEDYARLGMQDSARAAIDQFLTLDEQSMTSLISVAKAYEIMMERDLALQYLEAALSRGYSPAILEFSAWLDDLRQDVRYQQLVQAYQTPGDSK